MAGLVIDRVSITHPDATALVEAVQAEYAERYGGPDGSPIDPDHFEDPHGAFYVGYLDSVAVATGAWRRTEVRALGEGPTAEVKRMYVVPALQRRGLGTAMLTHLERTAAAAGIEVLVLETGTQQPEAIALYRSAGYEPIEPFGHYAWSELNRCFARRLAVLPAD